MDDQVLAEGESGSLLSPDFKLREWAIHFTLTALG